MLAKIMSYGFWGIDGYEVKVEIDINAGVPGYDVVGLADTAVKESKERVRAAIKNSGYNYPINKVIVNLAPAHTKKVGSLYDLPIATGILVSNATIAQKHVKDYIILGELSLDGSVSKVNGILPMLISAKQRGFKKFIIPYDNQLEASFIDEVEVYAVRNLTEMVRFVNGEIQLPNIESKSFYDLQHEFENKYDFKYVKGQSSAKRALEIAAAGGHNILMIGPPGAGKTMMAKAFSSILPDLTFDEALEVTKIHSVAGTLDPDKGIISQRPVRTPHHTTTMIALTGGGHTAKPGEISLAHNGVLFLDEMPEYNRQTMDVLRQPMEDGHITVARNMITVTYPANFILVGSMNPCPCGYYGSTSVKCKCQPGAIHKYLNKISGPLMDRIDLHIEVEAITYDELANRELEEPSSEVKKRVNNARMIQLERYKGTNIYSNSKMGDKEIQEHCRLDEKCVQLIEKAFKVLNLSARGYTRILKVARTIADLDGCVDIDASHIQEAIQYRSMDKKFDV